MAKMPFDGMGIAYYRCARFAFFPVLLGAAILLIFDRTIGTSFYLDNILHQRPCAYDGGNAILYQHLFGSSVTRKYTSLFCPPSDWFLKCLLTMRASPFSVTVP